MTYTDVDREALAECDRIATALVEPFCHGPAADAWQQEFRKLSQPQRTPMTNPADDVQGMQLVKLAAEHPKTQADFMNALTRRAVPGGQPSAAAMVDAAREAIMNHSAELMNDLATAEGRAPDLSQAPPAYVEALRRRGATNESIIEAASYMYPGLSRADALKAWTAKVAKMNATPATKSYIPGESVAEESDF
jgi:hypothetical protein